MDIRPMLVATSAGSGPPLLTASLIGWATLIGTGPWLMVPGICSTVPDPSFAQGWQTMQAALVIYPPEALAVGWLAMLVAMMPPLLTEPMTHLWTRSLVRRRPHAIAVFIAGYASVWMLAGAILMTTAITVKTLLEPGGLTPAALLAVAALWQVAPFKQVCLNRCHRLPRLSAFGMAADRDCLRFGLVAGFWCVGSCWALMLLPLVVDRGHVALMVISAIFLLWERQAPARPASWTFRR